MSTDHLREYMAKVNLPFPVYIHPQAFPEDGTPETLMVLADGTVKGAWLGAYSGRTQREVETAFHLKLPGMVTVGTSFLESPVPAK
jgi:hypothetical protein